MEMVTVGGRDLVCLELFPPIMVRNYVFGSQFDLVFTANLFPLLYANPRSVYCFSRIGSECFLIPNLVSGDKQGRINTNIVFDFKGFRFLFEFSELLLPQTSFPAADNGELWRLIQQSTLTFLLD
ncbi:hypothetical protein QN277_013323 [Acacia crassicarpa]|uniref:Uncharacterized protein n=1 Tax=Acacia crassicarpa TaxID=499986 RepID=A0AAE1N2Y4_9FABA|nr:hypothetical protein QN277_013323 [Acacia crassicarpa]